MHGFYRHLAFGSSWGRRYVRGVRTRIEVRGPAKATAMWAAYADTGRWSAWAPHIRRVVPRQALEEGMHGVVEGPFAVAARFEVTKVDQAAGRWTWKVRIGPGRLTIDHEVSDGVTSIEIDGAAPLVLAYAPLARLALNRLVKTPG
jgi:hypothetical protein